ncbi:MAG: serralysin [Bradyrhizobium sp.]|jgi:hypothetical protein|nr:serralysin [Bradyrhizobium sp.]
MTNFFGSFIYATHRPFLLGAPADVYTVDTSGVVDVSVEISPFNIASGAGYGWTSEDAFRQDGSFYKADRGSGTATISGNFPANVSINWTFGDHGTGRFLGVFNADATAIIGHAVVGDSGVLPGIDVPLVLTASPSSSPAPIAAENAIFDALGNILGRSSSEVDFMVLVGEFFKQAAVYGLGGEELFSLLRSARLKEFGIAGNVLLYAATAIDISDDVLHGRWATAIARDLTLGAELWATDVNVTAIVVGAGLIEFSVPAGLALMALGSAAEAKILIHGSALRNATMETFVGGLGGIGIHDDPQGLTSFSGNAATAAAETLQIAIDPGSISKFDPGYYLAAHPDAVTAVASDAYANAYAYYLTVGIDRGDRPSAASAPVAASDIPDLALLRSDLNGFAPLYTGIFDLALGSMPTDGISTVEQSVAQVALAGHGSADATLTALANRLAIDLARNQHFSGTAADLAAGQFPLTLSTGATIADLQAAGAPGFGSFSWYVLSTAPGTTIAQIQTALHNDVLTANPAVTAATHFGIAEFGGVWVAIVANANAGTQVHAPLSEASGNAAINFYGTEGADFIYLGAHAGKASGGGGSDILVGSPGNDALGGGPGIDVAVFSGQRAAYTLTHSGCSLIVSGPDGVDTLTHIERLTFSDMTIPSGLKSASSDFSSDDFSDILWRNDNGAASIWDNGTIGGAHIIAQPGVVPDSWHISDNGDFDGNGHSDILWRNDNGAVSIWDNGQIAGAHIVAAAGVVPSSWQIAGTGDFDGNGHSDILWRNDNGAVSIWDNGAIAGAHVISAAGVVPNSWHIAGTADFDGDGLSDILWRNDNSAVSIWNKGAIGNAHIIANAGVVPASWHISGTGDFDGNGHDDILWRNDNSAVSIWDDGRIENAHIIANAGLVPNSWHIADTGDYDGNGRADILWRNDNGAVSIWDNGALGNAHIIAAAAAVASSWHIS